MADELNTAYLQPGTRIGFYEVVTLVGRGGFGALYKVTRDGEVFGLKLSTLNLAELTEEERQGHEERADREVIALKSLRHPNIVKVHAFERWPDLRKGYPYIVMDFVEGHRLYDWRRSQKPSLRRILAVFRKIALALNEMHRLEVFHRDLKSANVLVRGDDEPVVIDFGISRPKSTYTVTRADVLLGTFSHFSPEYCRYYNSADWKRGARFVYRPTADLHAVGYMLYQSLTGQPPFKAKEDENAFDLLDEIAEVTPPTPRSINPLIPPEVESLVMRLLEKDPALRFQTGADLATAIEQLLNTTEAAWDLALDVPPRLGKEHQEAISLSSTRAAKGQQAVEELGSSDLIYVSADKPPVRGSEVVPSVEISLSSIGKPSGIEAPPFSPPTAQNQNFVAPNEVAPAPAPTNEAPNVLEVPSVIRREGAKIEAAKAAAARSRLRTPLFIVIGVVGIFALVFGYALTGNEPGARQETTSGLIAEAERAETQLTPPLPAGKPNDVPPPAPTPIETQRSGKATAKGTSKNTDEAKIDELLAEKYGRPSVPAKEATPTGPAWVMRGVRAQDLESPPAVGPKKYGIPMGAKLRARLVTNLDSRTIGDGPVEATLMRPFSKGGEIVFPSRTMLYGKATTSGGRFVIALSRLRLPDNTEVAFDGLAMDPEDMKPGLPSSRRIAGTQAKQEGLATKVAKNGASTLLAKAASDDVTELAGNAGQTVLNHQEATSGTAVTEALLLDRGRDFDIFVKEAF